MAFAASTAAARSRTYFTFMPVKKSCSPSFATGPTAWIRKFVSFVSKIKTSPRLVGMGSVIQVAGVRAAKHIREVRAKSWPISSPFRMTFCRRVDAVCPAFQ